MPKATKVKFSKDTNTDMNQADVLMATVYIKGGEDVQVPVEQLADYRHNNADKIETRHRQVRRKMLIDSASEVKANQ